MTDFHSPWTEDKNPISEELQSHLAAPEGSTTLGMREALAGANKAFQNEITEDMALLMARTKDPQERFELMNEQKEWSEYNDASCKLLNDTYAKREGSFAPVAADELRLKLVERRALDLHQRMYKEEGSF
jgi:uncharacterized protein YecT (DUF1311 family)